MVYQNFDEVVIMSEFRKLEREQNELDRRLKEVASKKAGEICKRYPSYCIYTPKEALRNLANGIRKRSW